MTITRPALRPPHDVQMRVGRPRPHDIRARIAMRHRQSGGLGIEGPHDHPMRRNGDRRTCCIVRVGVAALGSAGEHIRNAWNRVCRFRLMSFEIGDPLHGGSIRAHRWIADNLGISWHAGEAVTTLAQDDPFSVGIRIDNARGLGDLKGACRHRAGDLGLHRLSIFGYGSSDQYS